MSRTSKIRFYDTWWENLWYDISHWFSNKYQVLVLCRRGEHQPVFCGGSLTNLETGEVTKFSDDGWTCLYCGEGLGDNLMEATTHEYARKDSGGLR